jgi:sugar phosphate permease
MTDPEYSRGLTVYYATYIASELPSNLLVKKVGPKIWLPLLTVAWGIVTMCLGFVKNYAGFVAVRAILGLTEGGLLPGIILYLSTMYKRGELAFRIGLFYTSASLSGAFGGLLARGLSSIPASGFISSWRWIMVIEGLLTVAVGVACYFFLPNNIRSCKFLTPAEREFAAQRLAADQPDNVDDGMNWGEVKRGLLSISCWLSAMAYFGILAGLYSFGLFVSFAVSFFETSY